MGHEYALLETVYRCSRSVDASPLACREKEGAMLKRLMMARDRGHRWWSAAQRRRVPTRRARRASRRSSNRDVHDRQGQCSQLPGNVEIQGSSRAYDDPD